MADRDDLSISRETIVISHVPRRIMSRDAKLRKCRQHEFNESIVKLFIETRDDSAPGFCLVRDRHFCEISSIKYEAENKASLEFNWNFDEIKFYYILYCI